MTLRLRLMLALVGLVAVGLLAADGATYTSLRAFLLTRVDQQLSSARFPVETALQTSNSMGPSGGGGGQSAFLPAGTYGQLRDSSGSVLNTVSFVYGQTAPDPPDLPDPLPTAGTGRHAATAFTTRAVGSSSLRYRVMVQKVPEGTLIVAVPLTETMQTLHRLLLIEVLVTAMAMGGLAAAAWFLVKRGLRPLEDMSQAAAAIAAGDLSRRVEPAESRTEVGRLGLSLNAMLEQIEQAFAERLRSEEKLRRFLADASHELRTPLTSIRGYSELFKRAKDDPQDAATAMRRIEEESARMAVLVNELLRLARLGEGREPEREPVDIARVASDCVTDARAAAPDRDIMLEAPDELIVTGDDHQLHQVVANLLANARQHTPAGSPVRVRLTADGRQAVLDVADEGPGLAPGDAARIFEPFYRADASRTRETGGTGLGLAIVKAIVHAHGGEVAVASEPGAGATFTVRLPLAPPEPAGLPAAPESPAATLSPEAPAPGRDAEPPASPTDQVQDGAEASGRTWPVPPPAADPPDGQRPGAR